MGFSFVCYGIQIFPILGVGYAIVLPRLTLEYFDILKQSQTVKLCLIDTLFSPKLPTEFNSPNISKTVYCYGKMKAIFRIRILTRILLLNVDQIIEWM